MFGQPYNSPYGSSPYSASPYSSPYSSYSPYSSPYGAASSAYGNSAYASPYGRYGGGYGTGYDNRFNDFDRGAGAPGAGWPPGAAGAAPNRGVVDQVQGGFATVGGLTEAMARITGMLDQNWQSLFGSFISVVRLIEGVRIMRTEFWALLKAVSLLKLLHSLYEWLRGPRPTLTSSVSENVADFLKPRAPRRSPLRLLLVLSGIVALLGPWLYARWRAAQQQRAILARTNAQQQRGDRSIRRSKSQSSRQQQQSQQLSPRQVPQQSDMLPSSKFGECMVDVNAQSARELSLHRGEIVRVVARVGQRWLAAEKRDGVRGLVLAELIAPRNDADPTIRAAPARSMSMPPMRSELPPSTKRRQHRRSQLSTVTNDIDDEDDDDDEEESNDDEKKRKPIRPLPARDPRDSSDVPTADVQRWLRSEQQQQQPNRSARRSDRDLFYGGSTRYE